ncbi:MAG: glycosyltransferase family 4 protein, partial [Brooklawnia sp.]|uniref:glycosyltransferase family 4 protein n=1 Tax=Brooklawnia sp. TaxID=2699740 RepID=UPI003C795316
PGTDPAELAPGSSRYGGPPTLLWLGRLSRIKDPLTFVEALTRLADLGWNARLVGPDTSDDDVTREVRGRIAEARLTDRIKLLGPQHGAVLEASWAQTDLLVHTSRTETYGMVVSEALARGVPSIVPAGTGAEDAQAVGASFSPGDVPALTEALRTWLTNPELRQRWRAEAREQRRHLPTWQQTAEVVASVLTG